MLHTQFAAEAKSEAELIQDFVEFSLAWLQERNYSLTIDTDMRNWAKTMGDAPASTLVNPTFDPRFNALSPQNSFWLDVRAGSHTIATSAARLFLTDDYLMLKRTARLWYDPPPPDISELSITAPPEMPRIDGRVGHEGGLWVHPEHRKRGLSVILPHLNRALCVRQWNVEWQTGLALRGIAKSGIAEWAYGFPHVVSCFDGYFPLSRKHEQVFITYMNRAELIAGLNLEAVAALLPNGYNKPVYAAAAVKKG